MTRPCKFGLGLRPRRLFGFRLEPVDGAPCFCTGSITLGGCGLPSTDSFTGLVSADNGKIQGGFEACSPAEKRDRLRRHRPSGLSVARGCELMELSRSTFYDTAPSALDAEDLLARIDAICDEFECYGYRRVGAALRHQGVVVNGKKLRRLMREHDLQPKRRRRFVVTTDSDHGGPIYPDLAKDVVPDRPNQLWVSDFT